MKVFISWSGALSKAVALLIRDWLPSVIQAIEPFMSDEDIAKGTRWFPEISSQLEETQYGICCVTQDNFKSPRLNFEAGALAKRVDKSHVTPLLINLSPTELTGPLLNFQATKPQKEDILKLVTSLNGLLEESLSKTLLSKAFEKFWSDFENGFQKALQDAEQETTTEVSQRTTNDLTKEILELTRDYATRVYKIENDLKFLKLVVRTGLVRELPNQMVNQLTRAIDGVSKRSLAEIGQEIQSTSPTSKGAFERMVRSASKELKDKYTDNDTIK